MKSPKFLFSAIPVLFIALPSASPAGQSVYTWTDENGVVHFNDRPPPDRDSTAIEATEAYRPGSVAVSPDAEPAGSDEPSYARQKREDISARRKQAEAEKAEQDRMCNLYRQQVANLEPHRRVYYQDENGETVRMDDVERVNKVAEYKEYIARNCNS